MTGTVVYSFALVPPGRSAVSGTTLEEVLLKFYWNYHVHSLKSPPFADRCPKFIRIHMHEVQIHPFMWTKHWFDVWNFFLLHLTWNTYSMVSARANFRAWQWLRRLSYYDIDTAASVYVPYKTNFQCERDKNSELGTLSWYRNSISYLCRN